MMFSHRVVDELELRMVEGRHAEEVFALVDRTPRSLQFQLDLLREVGFTKVDVLHKHSRFASFGAVKG